MKGLSSHLIPLTLLTKKNATQKCFEMTPEEREMHFLLSRIFWFMHRNWWLSTKSQEQNGVEKSIIFISHILGSSDEMGNHGARDLCFHLLRQATTTYLMGKLFTVKTDHKNLVYLRVLISEFRFLIQHIPGEQNVVANGLTRVMNLSSVEILRPKRHMFVEDRIPRISFRTGRDDDRRNLRRHWRTTRKEL